MNFRRSRLEVICNNHNIPEESAISINQIKIKHYFQSVNQIPCEI